MYARLLAVGSLAVVLAAMVAIITAQGTTGAAYRDDLTARLVRDGRSLSALSDELTALSAGASPAAARAALRRAVASHVTLTTWLAATLPGDEWPLSSKVEIVLRRERAWLDTVAAVLDDPGRRLPDGSSARARRLRAALDELGLAGVEGAAVRGDDVIGTRVRARLR